VTDHNKGLDITMMLKQTTEHFFFHIGDVKNAKTEKQIEKNKLLIKSFFCQIENAANYSSFDILT